MMNLLFVSCHCFLGCWFARAAWQLSFSLLSSVEIFERSIVLRMAVGKQKMVVAEWLVIESGLEVESGAGQPQNPLFLAGEQLRAFLAFGGLLQPDKHPGVCLIGYCSTMNACMAEFGPNCPPLYRNCTASGGAEENTRKQLQMLSIYCYNVETQQQRGCCPPHLGWGKLWRTAPSWSLRSTVTAEHTSMCNVTTAGLGGHSCTAICRLCRGQQQHEHHVT